MFHLHSHYLLSHPSSTSPFSSLPASFQATLSARAERETGGDEHAKRELLEDDEGRRELCVGEWEEVWEGLRVKGERVLEEARARAPQREMGRVLEEEGRERSDSPVEMDQGEEVNRRDG